MGRLPVAFVPNYILQKLKSIHPDYLGVIDKTINIEYGGVDYNMSDAIGSLDARALEVLNISLHTNNKNDSWIGRLHSFSTIDYYNEPDKCKQELLNICDMMTDTSCREEPYRIERGANSIVVVLNDNFYIKPNETYLNMSKDLCEYMLDYIDERIVFQSVFYKAVAFSE